MSFDLTPSAFAFCAIVALLISLATEYETYPSWELGLIATGMLIIFWAVNNAIYMFFPLWVYLITDFLFTVFYIWLSRYSDLLHIKIMVPLMAANVLFDAFYQAGLMDYSNMMYRENQLFALLLLATVAPGIWTLSHKAYKTVWSL